MFWTTEKETLVGFAVGIGVGLCAALVFRQFRGVGIMKPNVGGRKTNQVKENRARGKPASAQPQKIEPSLDSEYKLVLVVNSELKMGKGKVAAQCAHAAVLSYEEMAERDPVGLHHWSFNGQAKVVLKAENMQQLLELRNLAREVGLTASLVRDAGRTQIAAGSITVLGVGPGPVEQVDQVTGHLKLC